MQPVRSNLNKESCIPTSSNCIIWQGPNLPCIGLCKEDSISEITYKLAVELCNIKDNFDFTDVDLECLLIVCTLSPEPEKTLGEILNLIINKVCCLSDIIKDLNTTTADEIQVNLANCFKPYVDAQGNVYTKLPHSQYTYLIGVRLCELVDLVNKQQIEIDELKEAVKNLQTAPAPTIPTVTPVCVTGTGVTPGNAATVDLVLAALEKQYCDLVAALGTPANLTTAQSRACTVNGGPLANATPLSTGTGSMATAFPGWVNPVTNFAQSMNNLWLTVCDIRAAVKAIQDNCCRVTCTDIIVAFDAVITTDTNGDTVLRLFFGQTVLPTTWYDCDQTAQANAIVYPYGWTGNKLTITDGAGHTRDVYVQLRKQDLSDGILNDPTIIANGYDILLTGTNIDFTTTVTVSGDVCVTDGTTNCVKCVSTTATVDSAGCCVITNDSTEVNVITYKVC